MRHGEDVDGAWGRGEMGMMMMRQERVTLRCKGAIEFPCPLACLTPPPLVRIRVMGHPRIYATWKDETLNAMLARISEQASLGNFDSGIWTRVDLQVYLGMGGDG
eukprot:3561207-Pyramimonas_sp.AAC.1